MERFQTIGQPGAALSAILHMPETVKGNQAVLIVVGGPQYRVGSHRMFVLLARAIAKAGIPVLRFDFRGMGDSDGEFPGFDAVSDDIRTACDALASEVTVDTRITIIGLCDGASAAAIYADTDSRVDRLVLLNPWVHTEAGEAKAFVWYYYPRRLLQVDFWKSLFSGRVNIVKAIGGLLSKLRMSAAGSSNEVSLDQGFIARMRRGLVGFNGKLHILLSDTDLTAEEFRSLAKNDDVWGDVVKRAQVETVTAADHTFSTHAAMAQFLERSVAAMRGSS